MASPAMVSRSPRVDDWEEFLWEAERQVRECNTEAGENLWTVRHSAKAPGRFTIASTTRAANRVECSFDAEAGALVCKPGAEASGRLQFQLAGCTPARALGWVLDLLAEADDE
jgi:hypothetical protein